MHTRSAFKDLSAEDDSELRLVNIIKQNRSLRITMLKKLSGEIKEGN